MSIASPDPGMNEERKPVSDEYLAEESGSKEFDIQRCLSNVLAMQERHHEFYFVVGCDAEQFFHDDPPELLEEIIRRRCATSEDAAKAYVSASMPDSVEVFRKNCYLADCIDELTVPDIEYVHNLKSLIDLHQRKIRFSIQEVTQSVLLLLLQNDRIDQLRALLPELLQAGELLDVVHEANTFMEYCNYVPEAEVISEAWDSRTMRHFQQEASRRWSRYVFTESIGPYDRVHTYDELAYAIEQHPADLHDHLYVHYLSGLNKTTPQSIIEDIVVRLSRIGSDAVRKAAIYSLRRLGQEKK